MPHGPSKPQPQFIAQRPESCGPREDERSKALRRQFELDRQDKENARALEEKRLMYRNSQFDSACVTFAACVFFVCCMLSFRGCSNPESEKVRAQKSSATVEQPVE